MPLNWQDFQGMTPDELRRKYTPDQIRSFRDQIANQLQTPTGTPAIDMGSSGVDFLDRAKLGFAVGDEGKANILRQSGYEPVRLPDGQVGVRGKDGVVRPVDEKGFGLGDLADFAGDIPGTAGGIAGGMMGAAAGGGVASLATGMAGGAAGSALGEGVRQQIGQLLGSGEEADLGQMGTAALWGAAGEGAGRAGSAILKKMAAPFKSGMTGRIGQVEQAARGLDQQFGTNVAGALPVSARTESPLLGAIEQRVSESLVNGDQYRKEVARPFQGQLLNLFDRIAETAGPRSGAQATGDGILNAAAATLDKRKAFVEEAYNKLREAIPQATPAVPKETQAALIQAMERMGLDKVREFETAQGPAKALQSLLRDTDNIRTFEQLDAFRKLVGNMLNSRGAAEEFARVGLDAHLGNVYRGLLADSQRVLGEAGAGAAEAATRASGLAKNMFELDQASASRLLRDPDAATNIVDRLTRMESAQVRRFKEKIGAAATDAGLPVTEEGTKAWQQMGAELLARLRAEALNPDLTTTGQEVLSGKRLLTALDRAGGEETLTEILGKRTTETLYDYARMLRDATVGERMFANTSKTGMATEAQGLLSAPQRGVTGILGAIGQVAGTKALGRATMTPRGQQWLTQGVMQSPAQQSVLSILGRLPMQEFTTSQTTQPKRRNK